jgi:hypothetical protein
VRRSQLGGSTRQGYRCDGLTSLFPLLGSAIQQYSNNGSRYSRQRRRYVHLDMAAMHDVPCVAPALCAASRKTRNIPHLRLAGTDFNGQTATRDTSLSSLSLSNLHWKRRQARARRPAWRKPNHDHRPLACATHHIRLFVPNGGIGEVGVKINAVASRRGGAQMAR